VEVSVESFRWKRVGEQGPLSCGKRYPGPADVEGNRSGLATRLKLAIQEEQVEVSGASQAGAAYGDCDTVH
jgi:hypothetical protein